MNEIRYEIIITFLENADKLKKTVQSCENQILENDRIIIVGTGNLEQIKSLRNIKNRLHSNRQPPLRMLIMNV